MEKIKTYQDFKKYTSKELLKYSNREDLTFEEGALFIQFCQQAIKEHGKDGHLLTEDDETLEHFINRKNNINE